jgi:ribonuclease E
VPEPAPADAPPAETADQAAPPAKPARSRKRKPEATPADAGAEPTAVPAANNDTAATDESGEPRRSGWWQRTFG